MDFVSFEGMENNESICKEASLLIIDDDQLLRTWMREQLSKDSCTQQFKVLEASSIDDALDILSANSIDIVVLDKTLKPQSHEGIEQDGIEHIPELLRIRPNIQIIVHTASDETDDIVRAIKFGALGFTHKGSDLFVSQVKKAFEVSRLSLEKAQSQLGGVRKPNLESIGNSLSMRKVLNEIDAFAGSDWPVLLLGESGVGKTTIAKMIYGKRCEKVKNPTSRFFGISIAAFHKDSVVRELFGSEQGAFTGSLKTHQGYFEVANGGTLFIDEIGEISLEVQALLLKAIDEKQITRMGSTKTIKTDFKLICATNRNLIEMVEKGEFREDLFMRISKSTIEVPSLKDREQDIPELVRSIFPRVLREARLQGVADGIPEDFIKALQKSPPRGNIRGLERAIGDLLMYSPKDQSGRTLLARWRSVPELAKYNSGEHSLKTSDVKSLSFLDIKNAEFSVLGDKFPGLDKFLALVERKILTEASKKFQKNRERAAALGLDEPRSTRKFRQIGISRRKAYTIKPEMGLSS